MSSRWKVFGVQREWPDKNGSVWIEDDGTQAKPWRIHCSACDEGYDFRSLQQAKRAADLHIKQVHKKS